MYTDHMLLRALKSIAVGGIIGSHSDRRFSFDFDARWIINLQRALICRKKVINNNSISLKNLNAISIVNLSDTSLLASQTSTHLLVTSGL